MKNITKILIGTGLAACLTAVTFWLSSGSTQKQPFSLTPTEKAWLAEYGDSIRYAPLPDSPPIDYLDNGGHHLGLTADYVRLIEEKLGVTFQIVRCECWKEVLGKLEAGEVDLVGSAQDRPERRRFLRFTDPYQSIRNVIIVRKSWPGRLTADDLQAMRIAIVERSATSVYLKQKYPNYTFIPVESASEGFRLVSFEGAEAMVADLGVASYQIEEAGIANLRVAGDVDYPWELRFGSRRDWPELNTMLNKALATIPEDQREAIAGRWITLPDAVPPTQEFYLKMIGITLLCTLLTIGGVILRNRTLHQKVTHHTQELGRVRQDHEKAARALDESEERFRMLVESSNDMIWEMDRFGAYTYVSPRVRDVLGIEPDELKGVSSFSLMSKEDASRHIEQLRSCTAQTTIDREITTFIHRDGRAVILESNGQAFADDAGELAGFHGVSRDITDRIEAEQALRHSEERFRNLVETTSDWIWEVDTEGRYTYISPQSLQLLGYTPKELIGRHFTDRMPTEEGHTIGELFREVLEAGEPIHSLMNINRHKDGRTVVLETSAVPFYDKEWNIQGYRGIDRDITDRVAFEKQLEFERRLFRSFMDNAPDLIYFKDAEGHFIEVNTAKAAEVNLAPEDLTGRTDFDFLPEEEALQRQADEQEVMRTCTVLKREEYSTTENGTRWYLTTKIPRYDEDGRVIGTFGTSWDITGRKMAEEQLRQLRALLSNAINSMPSVLVGVDAVGRVIQWNRQAEINTGLSNEEAIGLPLSDADPALAKKMTHVRRAIREGSVQREERVRVRQFDRIRYFDTTIYPLREGDVKGAVIRVDDVTDRVMMEDSIRNIVEGVSAVGRRFFGSMVNQLSRTLDADFTFIAEFADADHTEMRTLAVSDHGESSPNFEFGLANTPSAQVLEAEKCLHLDHVKDHFSKTQLLQTLEIDSYIGIPLFDSGNHPLGIMVALYRNPVEQVDFALSIMQVFAGRSASEIERLQATKELMELRNLLENIIDAMPSVLIGVNQDRRVMQWNREAEKLTGITPKQAEGKPLREILPTCSEEIDRVLKGIGRPTMERHERIPCPFGEQSRIVDITLYPITAEGSEGTMIRIDDVTDRTRIEEMMMQSEKMMSVGGLAAGMAHEINNPLAAILQNLQVLRNRLTHETETNNAAADEAGTSIESIQAYLDARGLNGMMDAISDAGRRAARIVDNMLSFSRKSASHFAPNRLDEIIERSIELASNDYNLKKRFDFRHIRIHRDYEPLDPVPCEGSQIQQVILNLLSNSAQAMAAQDGDYPDPEITLRLRRESAMVLIEVADNGPGMSDETRRRVFEPFFTTKEVGRGTGLGLSVSYFIITENHGGSMAVYSTPGQGTRFSIRIPLEHRKTMVGLRI